MRPSAAALLLALSLPTPSSAQRPQPAGVTLESQRLGASDEVRPATVMQVADLDCDRHVPLGRAIGGALGAGAMLAAFLNDTARTSDPLVYVWTTSITGTVGAVVGGLMARAPECRGMRSRRIDCGARVHTLQRDLLTGAITGYVISPVVALPAIILSPDRTRVFDRAVLIGTAAGAAIGGVAYALESRLGRSTSTSTSCQQSAN